MTVDDCRCNTVAQCSVADEKKKTIRYTHYPFHVSENLEQVGGSTNIELEEEVESLTALSFKLGERRKVKTQKTNEMQRSWKLLELGRLT